MGKIFLGQVVSEKMRATVTVLIKQRTRHPFYQKTITRKKKIYADNEKGARLGDWVKVKETRPLSRLKRFKVIEITKK